MKLVTPDGLMCILALFLGEVEEGEGLLELLLVCR